MSQLLRVAVLAASPWPLVYACATPALVRAYPRRAVVRGAYLIAYVTLIVALAIWSPWLLIPFAAIAVGGCLIGLWRARPGYGRAKGLPPGALAQIPVRPFVDEDYVAKQIARHGPVSKTTLPTLPEPAVCIYGHRRGAAVLREHDERLGPVGIAFDALIPAGFLRNMAPEDHLRYKSIFRDAFTDAIVERCRPAFVASVRAGLSELATASAGDPRGVGPRPHLAHLTETAFGRLFFALEPETDDLATLQNIYREIGPFVELPSVESPLELRHRAAADEMTRIIRRQAGVIATKLARGDDPGPSFLAEIVRGLPEAAEDQNVTLNLVFLLRTASTDVTGLLSWVVRTLGSNPEWNERVRESDGASDLPHRIVLETLRLEQSEFIQRRVFEQIEVDGYVVPRDWYLRLCVHEAHRDPSVFPNPNTFDPDRFLDRRYSTYEFSPFGRLSHACIGVSTTLTLGETFVGELASGYDWRIVGDGPPEFNRYHWQPSRRLRISMRPRSSG